MEVKPDGVIEHNGAGEVGARNIVGYRRLVAEGLSKGSMKAIEELISPDLVDHQDYGPGFPPGRPGVKALESTLKTAIPDMSSVIQEIVAVDDQTWARVRSTGKFTGPYLGVPPSGRPIDIVVVESVRWKDGVITEHWGVADRLTLLYQMGLIPEGSFPVYRPSTW